MEAVQERTDDEGDAKGNGNTYKALKITIKIPRKPVTEPVEPAALDDRNVMPNPKGIVERVSVLKEKRKINVGYDDHVVGRDHVCVVCAKGFLSEKSLCGHMKTHPDRSRKGIQPRSLTLESNASGLSSSISESGRVDLLTTGWLVKRKRGRGRGRNSPVSSLSSVESERSSLARILMQLFQELHEKQLKREQRKAKARISGSSKLEWDSDDEYWLQDCFPPGWDDDFRRDYEARKADELGLSRDSFRINGGVKRASSNKRRKLDHSAHHETGSEHGFVMQASRNKRRKLDGSPHQEARSAVAAAGDVIRLEEGAGDHSDMVDPPLELLHQRLTCGRRFSTGHALGRHMRAHYTKPLADPVESIDEPEVLMAEPVLLLTGPDKSQLQQGEGVDQGTGGAVLPFDLNELPIEVYLEDGHGFDFSS